MKKYVQKINGVDHVFRMTESDAKAKGATPYEAPAEKPKRSRKKAAATPKNKATTPATKVDANTDADANTEAGDGTGGSDS